MKTVTLVLNKDARISHRLLLLAVTNAGRGPELGLRVSLGMQREVVGAREAAVAVAAAEGLRAGVLAVVSSELV